MYFDATVSLANTKCARREIVRLFGSRAVLRSARMFASVTVPSRDQYFTAVRDHVTTSTTSAVSSSVQSPSVSRSTENSGFARE
eukprot:1624478-Prymnesium_polylepis.1